MIKSIFYQIFIAILLFIPFIISFRIQNTPIPDNSAQIFIFQNDNLDIRNLEKHIRIVHNIQCHPEMPKLSPYRGIWQPLYSQFHNNKTEALYYFALKMKEFKSVAKDDLSLNNIDFLEKCLYYSYFCYEQYKTYNKYQEKNNEQFKKEIPELKEKYIGMDISIWNQEVYFSHHGLRFTSEKIKNYLKNRDLFDIGSYNGDSCLILTQYTNKKVYSYDNSKNMIQQYKANVERNNIPSTKYELNYVQLGDFVKESKNSKSLSFSTVDNEVKSKGLTAGLIKADVEGGGCKVIRGSMETLRKQHPVVIIAVYHCPEEMFGIFDILKNEVGGYNFEFHTENSLLEPNLCEFCIFAYPKSILDN